MSQAESRDRPASSAYWPHADATRTRYRARMLDRTDNACDDVRAKLCECKILMITESTSAHAVACDVDMEEDSGTATRSLNH